MVIIYYPCKKLSEHLYRLDQVLTRPAEAGLKLKCSKCKVLQQNVVLLGHVVSKDSLKPDENKTKCIKEWPVLRNVHEVRSFCGFR